MARKERRPTEKQRAKFKRDLRKLVAEMVERVGGRETTEDDYLGRMYSFVVPTEMGDLLIDPHEDWIAGRFVDVDAANTRLNPSKRLHGVLNPYTGKWNHHASWGANGEETWANIKSLVPLVEAHINRFQRKVA